MSNIKINCSRFIDLETELGKLFLLVFNNKISLQELRKQGRLIEDRQDDNSIDLLLEDALYFLDELHDSFAVREVIQNPEILERYAKELLGEISKDYYIKPNPGIQVKITYEKYDYKKLRKDNRNFGE